MNVRKYADLVLHSADEDDDTQGKIVRGWLKKHKRRLRRKYAVKWSDGQETEYWDFELNRFAREQKDKSIATLYIKRPGSEIDRAIIYATTSADIQSAEDRMVAYAEKYSNIHNRKWTWDELAKLEDPPSAEHAIIDPRFHALWESMKAEVQGFYDRSIVKTTPFTSGTKTNRSYRRLRYLKSKPQGENWTK